MLKKPGLEELVRELERDYARWEQVYMAGSKDPFWPDGVNADLCRNHILSGKKRIRELYPDAEMPEILPAAASGTSRGIYGAKRRTPVGCFAVVYPVHIG